MQLSVQEAPVAG